MPQSARATFKPRRWPIRASASKGFNASIGTSNLQAPGRHNRPAAPMEVSMPQSARATFKLPYHKRIDEETSCFNASIGTSNLQAPELLKVNHVLHGFNASIGTSNLQACHLGSASRSAGWCFNASIGTSNLQASISSVSHHWVSQFQCLNRHEQPSSLPWRQSSRSCGALFQCLNRHEQPSSGQEYLMTMAQRFGFNASIGTSNLQAKSLSTWYRRR